MPGRGPAFRRGIASVSLAARQVEKQGDRFFFVREIMGQFLPVRSNPTPAASQADFSEQCAFNGKGIKPRHVLTPIGSLDINPVGLRDHGRDSRISNLRSNETFESVR